LEQLEVGVARRPRADDEQARAGPACPEALERLEQLWDALALVDVAEGTEQRLALDRRRLDLRDRPRGHRHLPDRPFVAGCAGALLDLARVDHQTGRSAEHPAR